jgi:hypothetical protein
MIDCVAENDTKSLKAIKIHCKMIDFLLRILSTNFSSCVVIKIDFY